MFLNVKMESTFLEDVVNYIQKDMTILLIDDEEDETNIGQGEMIVFSTKHADSPSIRELCDGLELHLYQTVSSVRIFNNEFEAEEYEMWKKEGVDLTEEEATHDDPVWKFARELGVSDVAVYEENDYDDNTISVYGTIAILSDLSIGKEYQRKGYGTQAMEEIINYCKALGIDFILLKPFPPSGEDMDEIESQRKVSELLSFYEPLEFKKTIGRAEEVHLCLRLV
ncbi:GNAT family N-acetyltransferase [Bacillus sp. DJP31]|uniref:GNAT family N-acetyltransferase n=1 Tax=Bacillus sp. DJP31 TaxID=3409789 RepID=UPI003BB72221